MHAHGEQGSNFQSVPWLVAMYREREHRNDVMYSTHPCQKSTHNESMYTCTQHALKVLAVVVNETGCARASLVCNSCCATSPYRLRQSRHRHGGTRFSLAVLCLFSAPVLGACGAKGPACCRLTGAPESWREFMQRTLILVHRHWTCSGV